MKKKDQISFDEETAFKLQIDVDHQLAERLQAQEQEELSIKEKATLFQQLLEKRRKHFGAKRAEVIRNKPPTKAQQRKIMCTYLKNMEGYKLNDLKLKDFDSIQEMFDRDEEEVAIDVIPLAVKSPSIIGWKIYKEGRKSYYQIMRADGKSQMYMFFSQMLKNFDREDLEDLYKVVKAKFESTKQVEELDLVHSLRMQHMQIYMLVEKKYPLAPLTLSMMLEKKLNIDYEKEYQVLGRIVGIKRLLDAVRIIAAPVYVNTTLMKLVLLMNFKENILIRGLPKLKYQKDHLCSAYALGKSKKHSYKPKAEDSIEE
ncbi:hypothetical protein Tco_0641887 [Tanacetum coccineum]